MNLQDYIEAGFRVFGIHGVERGVCGCGDPDCKALFKHPVINKWQSVPHWSDEQMDVFHQMGHFDTGFGVLCSGWLVIDVDARNGGVESFSKLCKAIPSAGKSEFVVNTGSGGGSQHHYFRMPEPVALVQSHKEYPGIDFKGSGYVIGSGSMHASGATYERVRGFPQDVSDAPAELVELLRKPERYRVSVDGGGHTDYSLEDLHKMTMCIPNDDSVGHETYIRVGMALHDATGGDYGALEIWREWAEQSPRHKKGGSTSKIDKRWHAFGKGGAGVTVGTLLHYAREGGYCEDVTFVYDGPGIEDLPTGLDTSAIDLKRPPGFVGELCEWINGQCLYPRETLSVAAALCAVSGLAGMRSIDTLDDMSANIIAFCVAGSGTGKEAVQQAYLKIMRTAGVQGAVHGAFKSEQELMRNLIRHQAAFYSVDELGLVLRKLENASKKGGASYLEGIIGTVMSVYSKANGYLPISGDLKEEIKERFRTELSRVERRLNDLEADSATDTNRAKLETQVDQIRGALATIDDGLDSPYLTILGYTTPVTFDSLMGFEQATNGFMARAMIFSDLDSNPARKKGFIKKPMSDAMQTKIRNLYAPGHFDALDAGSRVEFRGEKTGIPTTPDGQDLLEQVYEAFHGLAEDQKGSTGLEAIPRRGYEIASKVSLVLALPGGLRTAEHILWGYALALRDVEQKLRLARAEDKKGEVDGLAARVLSLVTSDHGETLGVICNRLRSVPRAQVEELLKQMVDKGMISEVESMHPYSKKQIIKYFGSA